jgi:hypothetical protein
LLYITIEKKNNPVESETEVKNTVFFSRRATGDEYLKDLDPVPARDLLSAFLRHNVKPLAGLGHQGKHYQCCKDVVWRRA